MSQINCQLRYSIILFFILACCLLFSLPLQAANWVALPPYNVLWPLWSPALSPPDTLTGLPIPYLTHVNSDTILPVQPGLVWDPAQQQPYLLYNNPIVYFGGLLYFNQLFGFNSWPPPYMLDPETSYPLPVNLPLGYTSLPPTDYNLLSSLVPLANSMFLTRYGVPVGYLLTADQLWGI